jgi:hypothetical protein
MNAQRLDLNLASHPLRNRRFFFFLFSLLTAAFLALSFLAGGTFIEFNAKSRKTKAEIKKTERLIKTAQREEKSFSAQVEEAAKNDQGRVDLMNSIILRKSFSWTDFFSDLESSLPDSSYIVSLAQTLSEDSRMQVRFKVATPDVKQLLEFLNKLNALRFAQAVVNGEAENERGLLISEVSLIYERSY